jgi:putative membrane protein
MAKASALFTDEDKRAVSEAIADAEKQTSGEIVPVVATQSGRYDRAEDTVGLLVALVGVTIVWLCFQGVAPSQADWETGAAVAVGLPIVLATILVCFAVGAALATYLPMIARPFLWSREIDEEVQRGARQAFFDCRVRRTQEGTGILIYVSLYERRVRIIGDDSLSARIDQEQWDAVKDLIVAGIRGGGLTEGLCAGIRKCGELLAEHFPIAPDDVNELTNELRLID